MKRPLRKIDESGLFVEDVPHWDDEAKDEIPEVIGVPLMQDGVQATDDEGNLLWEIAPQAAIPAVPPLPFPANHVPGVVPGGFIRPKWDGTQWIEGGTPTPIPVPTIVSMRKARLALLGAGMLATVNDAIAAMTGAEGEAARIEWEYATEVDRNSALVAGLAVTLGLTPAQLDTLFTAAAES